MAPSVNSSCAPRGRNLSRPSRKMRLRWANSISTRAVRRDCSNAGVPTRAGEIAGIFMDATWDFALKGFRTASGLRRARATVETLAR